MKIKNRIISYKWRLKDWFFENITPHLPKIAVNRPTYLGVPICLKCHSMPEIYALNTGEGWYFFWDCEGQHISDRGKGDIVDWFPFLFGWATSKDLERIGIEVV